MKKKWYKLSMIILLFALFLAPTSLGQVGVAQAVEAPIAAQAGIFSVQLTPFNPPVIIPASGGSFQYSLEIGNETSSGMVFEVWTTLTLPSGSESDPVFGPEKFRLPGGSSAVKDDLTQAVTGELPAGMYTYTAYVGRYPNKVVASDSFNFEKLAGGGWFPQSSGVDEYLFDVFFADGNNGWAVGMNSTILHTSDGGDTWHPQSSPAFSQLYDVFFLDALHGWAVGDLGVALRTTDGGQNWIQFDPGATSYIFGIQFLDANTGYLVGGKFPTFTDPYRYILKTTDGGANWDTVHYKSQRFPLKDVFFVDADHGWAVGEGGAILHTTNGGDDWVEQSSGVGTHLESVNFTDANNGWAVGISGVALQTSDGGANWVQVDLGTGYDFTSVIFADGNNGWVAGGELGGGIILRTDDGGANWHTQDVGGADILSSIYFDDANNGWAVGWQGTILHTDSGGE